MFVVSRILVVVCCMLLLCMLMNKNLLYITVLTDWQVGRNISCASRWMDGWILGRWEVGGRMGW